MDANSDAVARAFSIAVREAFANTLANPGKEGVLFGLEPNEEGYVKTILRSFESLGVLCEWREEIDMLSESGVKITWHFFR